MVKSSQVKWYAIFSYNTAQVAIRWRNCYLAIAAMHLDQTLNFIQPSNLF